jgi:hypothetical protein
MTYQSDMAAEAAWNSASSRPGRQVHRTHPAYVRGMDDYHAGRSECPYLEGGEAARHWNAAVRDAARFLGVGVTTS